MFCRLGRIGPYLSDRILISKTAPDVFSMRLANSWREWFMRIISWIYSPASYTEENRKTIRCFQEMLKPIGAERLQRICTRYNIDFAKMEKEGSPLLSRTIAKISVGLQDVTTMDMEEALAKAKEKPPQFPFWAPKSLQQVLVDTKTADELCAEDFAALVKALGYPAKSFLLEESCQINGGRPTEFFARFFFSQFLADRERLALQAKNPDITMAEFVDTMAVRHMRREMEVGMLVPAPNHAVTGAKQFYCVIAKLITGEGFVSYVFGPATRDTDLQTIEFFRGTSTNPAEVDMLSALITDMEPSLGDGAWSSSKIYRPLKKKYLPPIRIVAGHSLGSTLAQRAIVKNSDIREAYLKHGPGIPDQKIEQFNNRMARPESQPIKLNIQDGEKDDLSVMGNIHLGYNAPAEKVAIDFSIYSAAHKAGRFSVHTMNWHDQPFCGMAGGHGTAWTTYINNHLNHKSRVSLNWLREAVGPYLVRIFRLIRDFFRWAVGSRVRELRGLQLGVYQQVGVSRKSGPQYKWTVHHIKPQNATKAMAANYPVKI